MFSFVKIRKMKTLCIAVAVVLSCIAGKREQIVKDICADNLIDSDATAIEGVWITQKRDSKIEISMEQDSSYSGKLVWVAAPYKEFTGKYILKGIKYNKSTGNFTCPWIYDPKLNVTAKGTARISGDTLYLQAHKGIFTKNEIFLKE